MCVGSACTQTPYIDKNPVSVLKKFLSTKIFSPFSNRAICPCDITRTKAAPTIVWLTSILTQNATVSYLRPA